MSNNIINVAIPIPKEEIDKLNTIMGLAEKRKEDYGFLHEIEDTSFCSKRFSIDEKEYEVVGEYKLLENCFQLIYFFVEIEEETEVYHELACTNPVSRIEIDDPRVTFFDSNEAGGEIEISIAFRAKAGARV